MRKLLILIVFLTLCLFSCVETTTNNNVLILNGEEITIELGETVQLNAKHNFESENSYNWYALNSCVKLEKNGKITGIKEGSCEVFVEIDGCKDSITVKIINKPQITLTLTIESNELFIGEKTTLNLEINPIKPSNGIVYEIVEGNDFISLTNNTVTALKEGTAYVIAKFEEFTSNKVAVIVKEQEIILSDPYENVTYSEFYANYTPASSSTDAYYRSLHGFMSGDISKQNQEPTLAHYQPMVGESYVRNTSALYSNDGNTYYIVDGYGNVVNQIYKGGGYVTLEEVAAYVLAFGDIPANYISKKSGSPSTNIWKEYLRLNHSSFSGSTTKYPYEPKLPRISGCGGDLYYYEIDLGTTGTDCDPDYPVVDYNNGKKIERGAARIVYTRFDRNKKNITDINEKYVFYTYNHYNDFQEYLNYEGGWGEMFGNITGGGTLSSTYDYKPTPYVEVERSDFVNTQSLNENFSFIIPIIKKEEMYL